MVDICSIPSCDRPVRSRGMCNTHYRRWLKHGDPGGLVATKAADGEPLRYLLEHMYDGCCYPWPYSTFSIGYPQVRQDGSLNGGHRIVCEVVNGPPLAGQQARHLCGKGHLCCFNAGCLEWGSQEDNCQDAIEHGTWAHGETHYGAKISTQDVARLRTMYASGRYRQRELAEIFDISLGQVSDIINFKQRKNG